VPERLGKAPFLFGLFLFLLAATGIAPAPIAALSAAAIVVLWRNNTKRQPPNRMSYFLVAALMPVGSVRANWLHSWLADYNFRRWLGTIFRYCGAAILSSMLSQALDSAPTVVLANDRLVLRRVKRSPSLMMAVALGALLRLLSFSASEPLVMGAGGYRAKNYFCRE
jgi:Na+/H+ antiporter NhaD/arsenite permease-like protein